MNEHSVVDAPKSAGHDDHHHAHAHGPFQAHHFETPQQQFDAGKFGMWLFLVQEVLFFSGLFVFYAIYRFNHPEIFEWGHQALDKFYGGVNTIVLIFSSLTMALAVRCAQLGQQRGLVINLVITLLCAFVFLGVKYIEYSEKFAHGYLWAGEFVEAQKRAHEKEAAAHADDASHDHSHDGEHASGSEHGSAHGDGAGHHGPVGPPPERAGTFFSIYFAMTGLHAIHVIAGIIAIGWILLRSIKGHFGPQYFGPVDYVGLYWHLVDLVWIYLFPMLYLIE
jgi:cytochrome c oxidase subunit 3